MNVHNLMEEIVSDSVNKLYEQLKKIDAPWFSCDCEDCRLDAISYVLNRIQPRYVVSGRGIIHNAEILKDNQLFADIDALGLEAIRIINTTKRPFHNKLTHKKECCTGPVFNFPIFTGSVFDGSSFEPLIDASISIKQKSKLVSMIDQTWNNPCKTYKTTKGAYSFWVMPVKTEKTGEKQNFHFTVEVQAPHYDQVTYTFEVPVTSEEDPVTKLNPTNTLKIQDLYLFQTGTENPME